MNATNQIDINRKMRLSGVATDLRRLSTSRQGNIEGWKISHLLRDAQSTSQADEAERQLAIWRAADAKLATDDERLNSPAP
jgi:hypothetical protein